MAIAVWANVISEISIRRLFFVVATSALIVYPLIYIGNYAGDAQVHLVYAQNAAQGAFFEFNPGEASPGVTSPGYMLLIAGFFKLAPDTWVPAVVKAANLLFWYGLLAVIFLVAKGLMQSTVWGVIAALTAGLIPGSAYNATNGMENGIFAFFVLLWILVAMRSGWFSGSAQWRESYRNELILGALLGLACWLRPEGFVVAAVALGFRALLAARTRSAFTSIMARSAVFLVPFLAFTGVLAYFHWSQTGYLIPTSGTSRILMSKLAEDTFRAGPLFFSPKLAIRLAEYFPLSVPWLFATWLMLTGRLGHQVSREVVGFLIILFWTAIIMYSVVLGSIHLSRYIIFAMPAMVLVAMIGVRWVWDAWKLAGHWHLRYAPALVMAAFAVSLVVVFSAETRLRLRLDSQSSMWRSMQAPEERQAFSDELFDQLDQPGSLPITLAMQEIQARYWLDQRFIVRSLDGRVDPVFLDYASSGGIDHIGYLKEQQVQYLLETPNYNRDPKLWSLKNLTELKPGEELSQSGVSFSRLQIDRASLNQPPQTERGEWPWFTDADGVTRLRWFLRDIIRINYNSP